MNPLEQRILALEARLNFLEKSDRYTVQKTIQLFDGRNIQLGTSIGTEIGTAANQKLGFFGATPVIQQATIAAPNTQGGGYVQADVQSIVTALNLIRTTLKNFGFTS